MCNFFVLYYTEEAYTKTPVIKNIEDLQGMFLLTEEDMNMVYIG